MIEKNNIYCMDCLEGMKQLPDNFVDLTVTSPPYDNLRKYNGFVFDFENIAKELFRITKKGGVVVWV
jgi:site-specific DNA-methyltransferase (adenine-specific)